MRCYCCAIHTAFLFWFLQTRTCHGFCSLADPIRTKVRIVVDRQTTTLCATSAPGPPDPPQGLSTAITKNKQAEKAKEIFSNKDARQILGIPGESVQEKWKIRLQLMKPISWIPLSLIVMCGAAASGNYRWIWNPFDPADRDVIEGLQHAAMGFLAILLAGPFSEGFAQTINDWYDRDIDAINEPYRPIPSGQISPTEVREQLAFLFTGGIALALALDVWAKHQVYTVVAITLFGYLMSYIYSAPPLKLKQNGFLGDLAIGLCYISLPWWCGHNVFGTMDKASDWLLPLVYSLTAMSAGIVNDFKSMEGDRKFGLSSIPILLGIEKAKWLAALFPDVVQAAVAAYFYSIGEEATAGVIALLILPQIYFQSTLLFPDPVANDVKYVTMSQPFSALSLIVAALCVGQHNWQM